MKPKTLGAALLVAFLATSLAWAAGPPDATPKIDALARSYVESGVAPGCVVGIVDGDSTRVLGFGRLGGAGGDRAPDGDTVYEIGSISKAFTGILLALAVSDGRVKLDDPLQTILPPEAKVPVAGPRPVTLADVATHSSGLPRMPTNFRPADPRNPYADYSVAQMYEFLGSCRPARPPGADYEYSNFAMGLLGHALALRAGKSYEELLVAGIADPLGMKSTRIALTPDMARRLAPGHDAALNPASNWDIPTLAGAGGIRSTGNDMVLFLAANLRAGDATPLGKAMALAREERWRKPDGSVGMGLGWHMGQEKGRVWHNGETGGYHAFSAIDAANRRAVVVLANGASRKIDELGTGVLRTLAGEDVKPIEKPREIVVPAEALERCVGRYAITPAFALAITREGNSLHVQATAQPKFPLFATSETEYFLKVVEARITFETAPDGGKSPSLTLHQNGIAQKALRVE